jgi:hypothetical protein
MLSPCISPLPSLFYELSHTPPPLRKRSNSIVTQQPRKDICIRRARYTCLVSRLLNHLALHVPRSPLHLHISLTHGTADAKHQHVLVSGPELAACKGNRIQPHKLEVCQIDRLAAHKCHHVLVCFPPWLPLQHSGHSTVPLMRFPVIVLPAEGASVSSLVEKMRVLIHPMFV